MRARFVSERDGWGTDPVAGQAVEESVATTLLQSTQAHSGKHIHQLDKNETLAGMSWA